MATSKVGTLSVDLFLNTARFFSDMDKLPSALSKTANKFKSIGKEMSQNITLPLVAIGTAALAAANKVDDAMDTIRAGTGATGKALESLGDDFKAVAKTVPASMEDVAQAITSVNTRLGLTGKPLQEMSAQILHLSRLTKSDLGGTIAATTRVFGDWSIATDKQTAALDTLFKTTQQTDIKLQRLAELVVQFGAPLRAFGFSFEQAAALMGKFEKEGVNLETVMSGLRFALGKFAAAGKDPEQALNKIIASIKDAKTESIATTLALETFGKKAAVDMARAIVEGRFAIDDLAKSIAGSSDTIAKVTKDTNGFAESWQLLQTRVVLALDPLGKELLDVFETSVFPALEGGIEKVTDLTEAFSDLTPQTKSVIVGMTGIIALLGPLALGIGAVTAAVGALTTAGKFLFLTPWGKTMLIISATVASAVLVWEKYSARVKEAEEHMRSLMAVAHGPVLAMASAHKSTAEKVKEHAAAVEELTKEQEKFRKEFENTLDLATGNFDTKGIGLAPNVFPSLDQQFSKNLIDQMKISFLPGGILAPGGKVPLAMAELQKDLVDTAHTFRELSESQKFVVQFANAPKAAVAEVKLLLSAGVGLVEIYEQYGGLLETYPELLGKGTRAALEMGKIQSILKDGWINIGRTIEQSVSRAVTSFKNFKDAITSIFGSIKQSILQVIGDILGAMTRRLLSPLLQGLAGALPLSLAGLGGASAGSSGLGTIDNAVAGLIGGSAAKAATAAVAAISTSAIVKSVLSALGLAAFASLIGPAINFSTNVFKNNPKSSIFGGLVGGLLNQWLNPSVSSSAVEEASRDFGGIRVGTDQFKSFLSMIGLTEKQAAGIRKDILSSPKFLTEVAYPLAVQQGKLNEFLKSLEAVKTSWGTFNFRAAFEKGLASGNFTELNRAFEQAFKDSKALVQLIPDFATRLAAATTGAVDQSLVRTRLTTRPIAVSPYAQPVLPGGGFTGESTGESGMAAPQFYFAPEISGVFDEEGFTRVMREKTFPMWLRYTEGNVDEMKRKSQKALGIKNA